MPLIPTELAPRLEKDWLAADGGSFPADVQESGQRLATAVATWFATAMAGPFPCATAQARQPQLANAAAGALAAGLPPVAGMQLAQAVGSYMTGQIFGPGTAASPVALPAAIAGFGAVFADLDQDAAERSRLLAFGCWGLALSTIVAFPPPLPSFPVL